MSWFMTIGIPYALVWLALVVLPSYHARFSPVIGIHAVLGLYLVMLILVNFKKVINTDVSVKQSVSIHATQTGECHNKC